MPDDVNDLLAEMQRAAELGIPKVYRLGPHRSEDLQRIAELAWSLPRSAAAVDILRRNVGPGAPRVLAVTVRPV